MAYGNNRAAARPRASFQTAGGTIIKFRHPILSGQISEASTVDEVDVSRALRLNETFLDANPTQDNAVQEILVDGSVVTITNHILAGEMTLQVMRTTGLVGNGDFVAALHLVIASKDTEGGTLTVIQTINDKRIVTIFYGVACKRVPHLKLAGNAVVPYPVVLSYAGWVQGVSGDTDVNVKNIWAVGNKNGLKAVYKPFAIQNAENPANYYGGSPLDEAIAGTGNADDGANDFDDVAKSDEPKPEGVDDTEPVDTEPDDPGQTP